MPELTSPPTPGHLSHDRTAGVRQWCALAVLMLPVLIIAIDNTVLSFALPSIAETLEPSGAQQLWIIDAYPLVLAGLLVAMGSLGDRIGRRRLLLIGATGFAAVSVVAAYSQTPEMLIAARAGLGFFGATLMPATLSLLRNLFTDRSERRLAIAIWSASIGAGAAMGPVVGGFLLEHFWWGSVFLFAIPLLVPLLILAPVLVPESKDPDPARIDGISIALSLLALTPIVYAIKDLASGGSLFGTALPALIGALAVWMFVRRQLRRPDPMLDVRMFTVPAFAGAVLVNLLAIFALVGFLYFVSQHLQLVVGLSPMQAGLRLLPGILAMVTAGLLAVVLARILRPAMIISGGMMLAAFGYATIAVFAEPTSVWSFVAAFAALGAGIGVAETISNDMILSTAPPEKAGAAAAISETAYELGAVTGASVLGAILLAQYRANVVTPENAGFDTSAARETLGGAQAVADRLPAEQASGLLDSAADAFTSGVTITSGIAACLMVVAGGASWLIMRKIPAGQRDDSGDHADIEVHETNRAT
ncbi:MFS transporter [Rhodococcus fascians]|nr:MFS transporter [Rhodococcus fascians]MBY4429603.1 MFS transporter [Rhodococcus fascians]